MMTIWHETWNEIQYPSAMLAESERVIKKFAECTLDSEQSQFQIRVIDDIVLKLD